VDFLELILGLLEPLLEGLVEWIMGGLADLVLRVLQAASGGQPIDPVFTGVAYCLFGILVGLISLIVFPHYLVRPSGRGISLFISPAIAGTLMSLTGKFTRWRLYQSTQLETFVYGFAFAFGMALMRLYLVK